MVKILTRINTVTIEEIYSILNVQSISWRDFDPWILLEIPAGNIIYQHLKPVRFEGEMECMNAESLLGTLENSGAVNFTTKERTKVNMVVTAKAHDGTNITYNFTNLRVRSIGIGELTEKGIPETPYIVTFYADNIKKV